MQTFQKWIESNFKSHNEAMRVLNIPRTTFYRKISNKNIHVVLVDGKSLVVDVQAEYAA